MYCFGEFEWNDDYVDPRRSKSNNEMNHDSVEACVYPEACITYEHEPCELRVTSRSKNERGDEICDGSGIIFPGHAGWTQFY